MRDKLRELLELRNNETKEIPISMESSVNSEVEVLPEEPKHPNAELQPSHYLRDFLKRQEGFRPTVYNDQTGKQFDSDSDREPKGVPTLGFGSTRDLDNNPVTPETPPITKEQAKQLKERQIMENDRYIKAMTKDLPLNQNQYDVLHSLFYNMGVGNFKKSKMYQHILNKDLKGLGDEMTNYNASKGKKMGGLVNRRQKEQEWFKQDPDAFKNKMELLKNKILRGY